MKKMPFLALNQFLREKFGERVQKIPLDAGLSCPNRDKKTGRGGCIYCNGLGSGTGSLVLKNISIFQQMKEGMAWAQKRYKARKYIAYFQSFSNTYGDPAYLYALYKEAIINDKVVGLFIGTRPDCINQDVLHTIKMASSHRFVAIELGLQSANDKTLRLINRGHTVRAFEEAVSMIRRWDKNIHICAHIIFGLPSETKHDMLNTIDFLRRIDIDGVKFHQLYILKNTPISNMYRNKKIAILSMEDYCNMVSEGIKRLKNGAVIHRLQADPPKADLIAPDWSLKKHEIREKIISLLGC